MNGQDDPALERALTWCDIEEHMLCYRTNLWVDLGYRVVPVAGLTVSAMYGGSLRCCVKVLSRAGRESPMRPRDVETR